MCFKPPKPPPVRGDPQLILQNEALRAESAEERARAKRQRTEDTIARLSGTYGRGSLLSVPGGAGFPMPMARSLFAPNERLL